MTNAEPEFIYVTTTGWKTGTPHDIEIWYVEREGRYYIISENRERSHWVQNIQHNPAITLRVGETTYRGIGRPLDPATEPELVAAVSALMNEKYEWSEGLIVELTPEGA
ncbi:MAG: nitroreductase family deazaflavin-dependent oxidoreductase [Chloroflexi bacterium]|nr:nitroreductase family deazaflavin-dependent oxidoreductase [Chloroflexota bacterium]